MYIALYIYRVPKRHVDAVVRIAREAGRIYREYGALDTVIAAPADLTSKDGCTGLAEALKPSDDEVILVEYNTFHDAEHHRRVMAGVDADPRISRLFRQMRDIMDLRRVVRGDFQSVT